MRLHGERKIQAVIFIGAHIADILPGAYGMNIIVCFFFLRIQYYVV